MLSRGKPAPTVASVGAGLPRDLLIKGSTFRTMHPVGLELSCFPQHPKMLASSIDGISFGNLSSVP